VRRRISVSVGFVVAVGLAFPTAGSAQTPAGDSATGQASDCLEVLSTGFCRSVGVFLDAHSGPAGENPVGGVRWNFGHGTPSSSSNGYGSVTCLSVDGNVAVVGFTGSELIFGQVLVLPAAGLIRATDRGGPDSAQDIFEFDFEYGDLSDQIPLPGPTDCTFAGPPGAAGANEEGDLTVADTRPLPTTKDQCRNGGWRTFGIFENQGDCVSSVTHQARQECIFIRATHGPPAFRAWYGSGPHKRHAMRRCVRQRGGD